MPTQNESMIEYLKSGKALNKTVAREMFGVTNLPSRISEIRRKGHKIRTSSRQIGHRQFLTTYTYVKHVPRETPQPIPERVNERLRSYGLNMEQYSAMIEKCGNVCEICGREMTRGSKCSAAVVVDHCHVTGVVRGVICRRCNTALGMLGDSRERVEKLLNYITRTGG